MKRAVVVASLVFGCGDNAHPPSLAMRVADDPPAYGEAPFPTDAVREGANLGMISGLDAIVGAHADLLADHLHQLGGWGTRPAIEFFIEGPIDPATVPAETTALTDALVVLDVDPATPEHGSPIAFDWRYDDTRHVITGVPARGVGLAQGVRYAAVITRDIHGVDGDELVAGQAIERLTHAPPARWQTTADAYAELAAMPQLKGRIAGPTVFTTQPATDALARGREAIANPATVPPPAIRFPDPAIIFDTPARLDALLGRAQRDTSGPRAGLEQWGTDNPTGIAHDHVGVVATGTIDVARSRRDDTGTDGADDETFLIGAYGVPQVQSVDTIPITIVLPKTQPPASGLASYLDFFESFLNMGAIRDSIRQSALDEARIAMAIQAHPDLAALAGPYGRMPALDASHVAYLGESFATIVGTLLAAIEPSIDLYVLDVPGGGLLDQILPNSPEIGSLAVPFAQTIYRTQGTLDRFHPALSLMQAILDAGDSLAYAPHVLANRLAIGGTVLGKRSVICIQALEDETMPPASTYALARNFGLAVLSPDLDPPGDLAQVPSPAMATSPARPASSSSTSPRPTATTGARCTAS